MRTKTATFTIQYCTDTGPYVGRSWLVQWSIIVCPKLSAPGIPAQTGVWINATLMVSNDRVHLPPIFSLLINRGMTQLGEGISEQPWKLTSFFPSRRTGSQLEATIESRNQTWQNTHNFHQHIKWIDCPNRTVRSRTELRFLLARLPEEVKQRYDPEETESDWQSYKFRKGLHVVIFLSFLV